MKKYAKLNKEILCIALNTLFMIEIFIFVRKKKVIINLPIQKIQFTKMP